jgi:CubicO group peptidase (beta-lactamase class C family)
MARRRIAWAGALTVLAVLGWAAATREPDLRAAPVRSFADLERELETLRVRLRIPGMSAAIADGDTVIWTQGFGYADVERSRRAGPDSIYHLASVTKPYAATVVLQLVEEGRLRLDAPVSDFGITIERSRPVRVWHLLSHTSKDPPGEAYRYDGNAFGRLGEVVERVTGRSFASELTDRIIHPLALRNTAPNPRDPDLRLSPLWRWISGVAEATPADLARARATFTDSHLDRQSIDSSLATGYARSWGRSIWPSGLFGPMQPMPHGTALFAGGGLVASAPDVARFSIALDAGRLLKQETLDKTYTPIVTSSGHTLPYGLGWFIQQHEGTKLVWHYGHFFESSSLVIKIPARKLTFVALANSDGLSRWRRLGDGDVLNSPAAVLFLNWMRDRAG